MRVVCLARLYPLWQAFIAVSTEAPQLDQNYIHERVRAYAAGMQASEKYIVISK